VLYGLYLYFLGLSFRDVSRALEPFGRGRSHTAVWNWVQRYEPRRVFGVKRVPAFLVDETYVKVGSFEACVRVAVEPVHRYILGVHLSRHRNMIVAELFLEGLVEKYGKHAVYSDGVSWYPEACASLGLEHKSHSPYEKPDREGKPVPEGQDRRVRRLLSLHQRRVLSGPREELAQPLRRHAPRQKDTHDIWRADKIPRRRHPLSLHDRTMYEMLYYRVQVLEP